MNWCTRASRALSHMFKSPQTLLRTLCSFRWTESSTSTTSWVKSYCRGLQLIRTNRWCFSVVMTRFARLAIILSDCGILMTFSKSHQLSGLQKNTTRRRLLTKSSSTKEVANPSTSLLYRDQSLPCSKTVWSHFSTPTSKKHTKLESRAQPSPTVTKSFTSAPT